MNGNDVDPAGEQTYSPEFSPVSPEAQRRLLCYSRTLLAHALGVPDTFGGGEVRSAGSVVEATAHVADQEPSPPEGDPVYEQALGAFVTLRVEGELRGCIGSITTDETLVRSVRRRTLDAAFHDRRFPPLTATELEFLLIEHSVLSSPQCVRCSHGIVLGEHGMILTVGSARSVFLPEVPTQQCWTLEETLNALAVKAGLPKDAWREEDAVLQVFRTQHYGEDR